MKKWSVVLKGSAHDSGEDDFWSGEDFDSLHEANCHFNVVKLDGDTEFAILYHNENGESKVVYTRKNPNFRPWKDDGEWKREIAREAGMLHGIDAYNDVMGY